MKGPNDSAKTSATDTPSIRNLCTALSPLTQHAHDNNKNLLLSGFCMLIPRTSEKWKAGNHRQVSTPANAGCKLAHPMRQGL